MQECQLPLDTQRNSRKVQLSLPRMSSQKLLSSSWFTTHAANEDPFPHTSAKGPVACGRVPFLLVVQAVQLIKMINYNTGTWGLLFMLRLRGSMCATELLIVFCEAPSFRKHLFGQCRLQSSLSCGTLRKDVDKEPFEEENGSFAITMLSSYTAVLGFLVVFRSQLAYARWWEGLADYSVPIAMHRGPNQEPTVHSVLTMVCPTTCEHSLIGMDNENVDNFQQLLVKLMSLLYGFALQQVSAMTNKDFEIFDTDGLDRSVAPVMFFTHAAPISGASCAKPLQSAIAKGDA
eukprot:1819308-Amphidinium_carterae.1